MLIINPKGLFQAVCTKWMFAGQMFFAVIPIAEYDGTARMRTEHDKKIVDGITKDPKILEAYINWCGRDDRSIVNPTGLTHEDMGTILIMAIKE